MDESVRSERKRICMYWCGCYLLAQVLGIHIHLKFWSPQFQNQTWYVVHWSWPPGKQADTHISFYSRKPIYGHAHTHSHIVYSWSPIDVRVLPCHTIACTPAVLANQCLPASISLQRSLDSMLHLKFLVSSDQSMHSISPSACLSSSPCPYLLRFYSSVHSHLRCLLDFSCGTYEHLFVWAFWFMRVL